MDRDIDLQLQGIIDNARGPRRQEQHPRVFNPPPSDLPEWSFPPSSRRPVPESDIFNEPAAIAAPRPTFRSSYQPQHPRSSAPNRVSLLPSNIYNQQDSDPRVPENAINHFAFQQAPRPISIDHGVSRFSHSQLDDQTDQLMTAMLTRRTMPLQPRSTFPEPQNFFPPPQQQPQSRIPNPLRSQNPQITPPFNLSAFSHSPKGRLVSSHSSPAGQHSSPTERVSRRKVAARTTPASQPSVGQGPLVYPRTPKHQQSYESPVKLTLAHAPPLAHGIQLVSPHELPDRFRSVFPYELFNAVQSKCFHSIYRTNDNVVVSAPTGSGKTALLELAICRAVEQNGSAQFKIVYQAPTKSLCSERMRDWSKKFAHLNLECAELTGDTTHSEMAKVRKASIIVTTPEKWDSVTRKWTDHHRLVQMVQLFLIDEVHIVKEVRGATLEAVVSRMKTMGANVRFVALSATIPNSEDIAVWFGRNHCNQQLPAHRETFGEDFRPVKLQKHVYGFDEKMNDYVFEKLMDGKLPGIIRKHTEKKPIMVFCFTRKSCESTAKLLAEWWIGQRAEERAWPTPEARLSLQNSELQALAGSGVAFHHAGLDPHDRQVVENAFLKGSISLICCTSTLAMGVNLPCHLVILKGTVKFQDGHLTEYSDLEVMQMLGRAGRPQFENSAVAVIITKADKKQLYERMISGTDVLESSLHLNLIEHLNSEIGLGTVNSVESAKSWLEGTFLAVRMRLNPSYYNIEGIYPGSDTDQRLKQVCERDIKLLQEQELVTGEHGIKCTVYGDAMSRYMVQFETMKLLLSIPRGAKTDDILNILCQAKEFQDFRMKPNQRPCLRELNQSPFMKFPVNGNISTTAQKISLLIQSQLGGIEHPIAKEYQVLRRHFMTEKCVILDRMKRLIRCVVDCKAYDCDAISTRHALNLSRSFSAGFWEHSNLQLQQVSQIGPAASRKLVTNNVNSIYKLARLDTATIERYVGKNPPFGRQTKDRLLGFPFLVLDKLSVKPIVTKSGQKPMVKIWVRLGFSNSKIPVWNGKKPSLTFTAETIKSGDLVHFWRGSILQLEDSHEMEFTVELPSVDDDIKCFVACDDIVGTEQTQSFQHGIPASKFPPPTPEKHAVLDKDSANKDHSDDEFGGNELQDSDLLNVASELEHVGDSDGFVDVDDVAVPNSKKSTSATTLKTTSVQMPNGKWTCNHPCREGLRKNKNPCKHKCCQDGLDKQPKPRTRTKSVSGVKPALSNTFDGGMIPSKHDKVSKLKLKKEGSQRIDEDELEVIDLADIYEPPYSQLASRDYQKLHKLHTSIQEDRPLRMMQQTPTFKYGSGKSPTLPFAPIDSDDGLDDLELPSPSDLVKHSGPNVVSPTPIKRKFRSNLELPSPITMREQYDDGDPFEEEYVAYQRPAPESHTHDDLPTSFDAPMNKYSGSFMAVPGQGSPKLTSSFADGVFDFASFPEPNHYTKGSFQGMAQESPPVIPQSIHATFKREGSPTPEDIEVKRRRVIKDEIPHSPMLPAWVSEFDSALIDEFKDFVDFVD